MTKDLAARVDYANTYTDLNGLVWSNGGDETDDHLTFGGHETKILEIAKSLLPDDGDFLDIGAHVGLYTLNLATKAAMVYAVEANPKTMERLKKNLERNTSKFSGAVATLCVAAWDTETTLSMVDENGKATGGSTRCVEGDDVRAMPLDSVLHGLMKLDLVKIDVEGAEAHVLRGMRQLVNNCRPTLLIEMHDKVYDLPEVRTEVLKFLDEVDYEWNGDLQFGSGYYLVARHVSKVEKFEIEIVKAGQ